MATNNPRLLLLQIRNPGDPMQPQEVTCFADALGVEESQLVVWDLIAGSPDWSTVASHDAMLVGGSGEYSVTQDTPWMDAALQLMREVSAEGFPTFASCWGFQAMARALGGEVVTDIAHAEVGTHHLQLTGAGKEDELFGSLGSDFRGQMGHEDCVVRLPEEAVLLASSDVVVNQAYRLANRPIWCTQFHPELKQEALLKRVLQYPSYIEKIAGVRPEHFGEMLEDAPETEGLLRCFLEIVLR